MNDENRSKIFLKYNHEINKLKTLEQQKSMAINNGDLEVVISIDLQINETKDTLNSLKK